MTPKLDQAIDSIFKKLKDYKSREVILEKESLKRFVYSLLKQN